LGSPPRTRLHWGGRSCVAQVNVILRLAVVAVGLFFVGLGVWHAVRPVAAANFHRRWNDNHGLALRFWLVPVGPWSARSFGIFYVLLGLVAILGALFFPTANR
jgi:hypothetical protein